MKRRDFLGGVLLLIINHLTSFETAFAQSVPFSFWKLRPGELRLTQAIVVAAANSGANAPLWVTQKFVVAAALGGSDFQLTQQSLVVAGSSGAAGEMRFTQQMKVVAAKI